MKILKQTNDTLLKSYIEFNKKKNNFKKAEASVLMMVIMATVGAIAVIGFFVATRDGISGWGNVFGDLVSM